jgi:hypothetical protein
VEDVSSPIYIEAAGPPPDDDADDDGITDANDNCPLAANPGQEDADGDGLGDACDDDRDGDGSPNATDACPDEPGLVGDGGCPVIRGPRQPQQQSLELQHSGASAAQRKRGCRKHHGQARVKKCRPKRATRLGSGNRR